MEKRKINWRKFFFEFFSIFIGVTMAFMLSNWNEDRRERQSEHKTLVEIKNGLELDLVDLEHNIEGHKIGLEACAYFRKMLHNQSVNQDSFTFQYHHLLRDYITIRNKSGYESLKSQGLKLITNDSLRLAIISLYDYDYEILEKLEEEYREMQFFDNHYGFINGVVSPFIKFSEEGRIAKIELPISLSEIEKQQFMGSIYSIEKNRRFIANYYETTVEKVKKLIARIKDNL